MHKDEEATLATLSSHRASLTRLRRSPFREEGGERAPVGVSAAIVQQGSDHSQAHQARRCVEKASRRVCRSALRTNSRSAINQKQALSTL
jgi:hypothetical protein